MKQLFSALLLAVIAVSVRAAAIAVVGVAGRGEVNLREGKHVSETTLPAIPLYAQNSMAAHSLAPFLPAAGSGSLTEARGEGEGVRSRSRRAILPPRCPLLSFNTQSRRTAKGSLTVPR
jgi:hypothetical protein